MVQTSAEEKGTSEGAVATSFLMGTYSRLATKETSIQAILHYKQRVFQSRLNFADIMSVQ